LIFDVPLKYSSFAKYDSLPDLYNQFGVMKTKIVKSKNTDSWALPGGPISLIEFKAGI